MKILLCSPCNLDEKLGASKVYLGFKKYYEEFGCEVDIVSPAFFQKTANSAEYCESLKDHLIQNASKYDVVEYEHNILPFRRNAFPKGTLFSARSVLLTFLSADVSMYSDGLLGRFCNFLSRIKNFRKRTELKNRARKTIHSADVVLCSNSFEIEFLVSKLVCKFSKLFLSDFGPDLAEIQFNPNPQKEIVFLGTLDPRKGLFILPKLFQRILVHVPGTRFKLLGTGFFIKEINDQIKLFKGVPRCQIEIVQTFNPSQLSDLIRPSAVGVFPSKVEGCPFSVLEQMKAGIPVFGYNSPGLDSVLPPEWQVSEKNWMKIADMAADVLLKPHLLKILKERAIDQAKRFNWRNSAQKTLKFYQILLRSSS